MLPFRVIQIEQHRALQQNAARAHLPEICGSELPLIARSSSNCEPLKLNRQIPELEHPATYRKQTTETCSNRQKFQKRARPIFESTSFLSTLDFDASTTQKMELPPRENGASLQSGHTTSNRFWPKNRSHRKQTIKPRLTGARMHIRETAFSTNFQISAAAFNEELQLHREAPRTLSQSSNISRSHGRP